MKAVEQQLKEIYNKIVWTHKIQEKAADVNLANHKNIKLFQIIVSAATTGTLLASIFGKSESGAIVSAVMSAVVFGLEAYTKDIDFSQKSNQHAKTADALRSIREDYLSLLTDMKSIEMSYEQIVERRDQLKLRHDEILSTAPRTGNLAYRRAAKALNVDNDHTFTGSELDRFLPEILHNKE
jgi:hypothetical protein